MYMFTFSILNEPSFSFQKGIIDDIFQWVAQTVSLPQNGVLNIVFVEDETMQNLNKTYRGIDKNTDVLSFHYYEDFSLLWPQEIAGEMVFSESKIISQGQEYGLWEEKEFYKLLIHSLLHILWYDHEDDEEYRIMQELENKIWKEIFEKNC